MLLILLLIGLFIGIGCVSASDTNQTDDNQKIMTDTDKQLTTNTQLTKEVTKNQDNTDIKQASAKKDTNVKMEDFNGKIGDDIQLKATVKDEDNNNVNGGKVLFKVNKETIKINNSIAYASVINSTAVLNYTIPKSWNKTISLEAVYSGNSNYNSARSPALTKDGMKVETSVTIKSYNLKSNENIKLTSEVTDERGNPVSGGKVIYKINGATLKVNNTPIEIRVRNGKAVLNYTTIKSWTTKNITIQAVYSGNEIFIGSRSNTVKNTVQTAVINTDNIIKTTSDIIYLPVNVTDANGNLIPQGKITLYKNNKKVGTNSLINGKRELYLGKMTAGLHEFKLEFTADNYTVTTNPVSVTIKKVTPTVDLLLDLPQATAKTGVLELRAYATFNNTKLLKNVNDGYVIFKIDGNQIVKVNVNNSKALYNFSISMNEGSHIVDAYYVSTIYGNNSDTTILKTINKTLLNSTNTAIKGNKDPLTNRIALVNGVPNLSLMTNYVWADEDATYTLERTQYQEVTIRDSYSLYLNSYMSKYVAFKTKAEPDIYHVLRREKWNVIEKAINTNLVLSNGGAYPETITASLKDKEYTYSEVRDIQNTSYTCGPTSLSICSQALKTYVSEYRSSIDAGSTYSDGTSTSGLANAAKKHNMTATYYYNTTYNTALNELAKGGCALIFHTWSHYVAIIDISSDKSKVLVVNPSGTYNEGSHGMPTNWLTVDYVHSCFNNYDTSSLIIKLNYNLTSTTKTQVNNMYNNFGAKYLRGDTSERVPNL